jgi:hypothetical protein
MTTPQFLAWLDAKMAEHDSVKVVPPNTVLAATAHRQLEEHLRRIITDQILNEANVAEQIADAVRGIPLPCGEDLATSVSNWLNERPNAHWRDCVNQIAAELADRSSLK